MNAYTITHTHGCKVIDRPIPICDLAALMMAWSDHQDPDDKWIIDTSLSQRLGVSMVCGPLSAITAWRAELGLTTNGEGVQE
jgi:hypothetical protein